MLLIPCPWCGPRDEAEFRYGGQAGLSYPPDPDALSDEEWADYLFMRDNPKGEFAERWMHAAGCRRWFDVVRDTSRRIRVPVGEAAGMRRLDGRRLGDRPLAGPSGSRSTGAS